MTHPHRPFAGLFLPLVLMLAALASGCGGSGGRDPVLGSGGIGSLPPTVTVVTPLNNASGVPLNLKIIAATFSEPMNPITGSASMVLTCTAPCVAPATSVALDSTQRSAVMTLATGSTLAPSTTYTVTVTGASSLTTGLALASPFAWSFTTGLSALSSRPVVLFTTPATTSPGPIAAVPVNSSVTAAFSADMNPATLTGASFTLACTAPCVSPAGTVSYALGSRTATFSPTSALLTGVTYTATLTTAVTDVAGNTLVGNLPPVPAASNYAWTFSTVAASPPAPVSVLLLNPLAGALGVCPAAAINASFSVPSGARLDPASVNSTVFTVTGPSPALSPVTAVSVLLDTATGHIASFTPLAPLTPGLTYTATIKGGSTGIKDLAVPANALAANFSWSFTAGAASGACVTPVSLGTAALFGTIGGNAGMTNSGTLTVINGDIGTTAVSTAVTGFHDSTPGCSYTETGGSLGSVNGTIYTAAPPPSVACPTEGTALTAAIAVQASADALAAYNKLAGLPGLPGAANLAGSVLAPGVYSAPAGSFLVRGGDLTLDAQGNANAVWVFQMATTLTVGGPGAAFPQSVVLINGAQAKNVFWQVGSAATINAGGGGTMTGTIISQAGADFSTAGAASIVTLNGRVLSLGASVTLVNTVINVPAP